MQEGSARTTGWFWKHWDQGFVLHVIHYSKDADCASNVSARCAGQIGSAGCDKQRDALGMFMKPV